ncbi:hypothetical protein PS663_00223 [Pseudomonas fluorescens]|nr:hypothetical protein PS663_00223 [Pseudomonas fluorescens]
MENVHTVPLEYEIDGLSMTVDTWHSLQGVRGTQIYDDIEKLVTRLVADNKYFLIYDPNQNGDVQNRCDNTQQVEKLFHPTTPDAS